MKDKVSSTSSALAHEIAALPEADPADLKNAGGRSMAPNRRGASAAICCARAAYRIQEKALGGLKPSTRRLLEGGRRCVVHPPMRVPPQTTLKPGRVLLRNGHGTQHQVIAREDGIVFRASRTNRCQRSLTESPEPSGRAALLRTESKSSGARRWNSLSPKPDATPSIRKSSEEGLNNFNSLHAQREACEAFVKSQASEGWKLVKTAYDDGGLSGGTMSAGVTRLLADIGEGLVDVVVVYKVDRLTRSLADFAKMSNCSMRAVSFVAVTQQFNTTTSMGRLTLNVLLSFAQLSGRSRRTIGTK